MPEAEFAAGDGESMGAERSCRISEWFGGRGFYLEARRVGSVAPFAGPRRGEENQPMYTRIAVQARLRKNWPVTSTFARRVIAAR